MSPQPATSSVKGQKPYKPLNTETTSGQIAFVSFDANSSAATRQAVRKQAALASAATRKATIARKLAERQATSDNSTSQESRVRNIHGKRKRTTPCLSPAGDEDSVEVHAKTGSSSNAGEQTRIKGHSTTFTGYLSPNASDGERDGKRNAKAEIKALSRSSKRRLPSPATISMPVLDAYRMTSTSPKVMEQLVATDDALLPPTPLSLPSPTPVTVSAGKVDPFGCCPVEYHPIYDNLLHHMLTIFAPRGWPALKITRQEGLQWEWFMTQHALAEPSLFLVRLLFASGDMIRLKVLGPDVAWWLRSLAIKAINDALSDPERSISDGLILAVGRIALNEALYGDRNASNSIHRPAQRRMIDLRGGMEALPFPQLVKRLMRWADRVMSIQSGTDRLLPDDEDQGNATWTVKESVQVLEDWVPSEGKALRKKIAISDLLT